MLDTVKVFRILLATPRGEYEGPATDALRSDLVDVRVCCVQLSAGGLGFKVRMVALYLRVSDALTLSRLAMPDDLQSAVVGLYRSVQGLQQDEGCEDSVQRHACTTIDALLGQTAPGPLKLKLNPPKGQTGLTPWTRREAQVLSLGAGSTFLRWIPYRYCCQL